MRSPQKRGVWKSRSVSFSTVQALELAVSFRNSVRFQVIYLC